MARPATYTTEDIERINSYKGKVTPGACARTLTAAGHPTSRSAVVRFWSAVEGPAVTETVNPDGSVEVAIDIADIDLGNILREAIRDARSSVRRAKAGGLDADMTKHQDRLFKAIALLDKITPAPPPNPNDNPLVRLSAEACITKLHELLDRV